MANRPLGLVTAPQYNEDTFDIGDVKWSANRNPSTGWLLADGSAVSRTTYATLFAALAPSMGTFTVTIASPGVFTLTGHGLVVGDRIYLTTTGALPTGLAANTLYFIVSTPDANTFTVSATKGGAAINTSGTQSGTHTAWFCPYGLGDGSTTFNVPDGAGRTLAARSVSAHADVQALGGNDGTTVARRRPKHRHTVAGQGLNGAGGSGNAAGALGAAGILVGLDPVNDPLDAPAYLVLNLFIKYA